MCSSGLKAGMAAGYNSQASSVLQETLWRATSHDPAKGSMQNCGHPRRYGHWVVLTSPGRSSRSLRRPTVRSGNCGSMSIWKQVCVRGGDGDSGLWYVLVEERFQIPPQCWRQVGGRGKHFTPEVISGPKAISLRTRSQCLAHLHHNELRRRWAPSIKSSSGASSGTCCRMARVCLDQF